MAVSTQKRPAIAAYFTFKGELRFLAAGFVRSAARGPLKRNAYARSARIVNDTACKRECDTGLAAGRREKASKDDRQKMRSGDTP